MNPVLFALLLTNPPAYLEAEKANWEPFGLTVDLVTAECGEENAIYFPADRTVLVCEELLDRPALAKFVLNHEMGHALMHQWGIRNGERAADQLAWLMSDADEVYAAASWFLALAKTEPDPTDGHPPALRRAGQLLCLQSAYEGDGPLVCDELLSTVTESWNRILDLAQHEPV